MLVATDVAARGVHVDDVELVVHVDPPAEHKAYLHRSGRTARAGSAGDVVTVVLPEQRKDLAMLMRKAAIKVTPQQVTADSEPVNALVGEIAPHVIPAPKPATQPQGQGGGGRRGGAAGAGQRRGGAAGRPRTGGGQGGTRGGRRAGRRPWPRTVRFRDAAAAARVPLPAAVGARVAAGAARVPGSPP